MTRAMDRERVITDRQLALGRRIAAPRTREDYVIAARWWELEAERGYASARSSIRYSRNMRWAAELAAAHGPGTWLELLERSGNKNPEPAED